MAVKTGKSTRTRSRTPARARSGSRKGAQRGKNRQSLPVLLFSLIGMSWFGRVLLAAVVLALVVAFNLLVSRNQYDVFFIMTGIELVAAALVFWLRMILSKT